MADWNVGTSILTNFVDGDGEMHGINDVERKPLHAATGHEAGKLPPRRMPWVLMICAPELSYKNDPNFFIHIESRCNFFSGHQG